MRSTALIALLIAPSIAFPAASQAQPYSELDVRRWGNVYDVPATRHVTVRRDVPFHVMGARTLAMDVYTPPGLRAGERRPAVVFMNGVGDDDGDRVRNWAIYRDWARLVAAHGMVGITMDAMRDSAEQSIAALFTHLSGKNARSLGIDSTSLGLYTASANTSATLAYLASSQRSNSIRAAVIYYGGVPQHPLPRIPTLVVVAQGDAPRMRPHLDSLWKAVIDSATPWTLLFARGMPHAFDAVTDNDDARRIVQQTIAFWKSNLEPMRASAPTPLARRIVESTYGGDHVVSARLLGEWVETHPSDTMALQMMGRALANTGRAPEAEAAFTRALRLDSNSVAARVGLGSIYSNTRRWASAVEMLEGAVRRGWETSLMQGQIGFAYLNLQRYAEGARAYERAFELGIPPGRVTTGIAAFNLACAYARLGRTDDALTMINRAVEHGVADRARYEGDADLASLRGDARFQSVLARLR